MYQRQVTFTEAVNRGINNLFNFSGRSSRSEFWWFYLLMCIISYAISFPLMAMGKFGAGSILFTMLGYLVSLAISICMLGIIVRRLHDVGKGGGWIFIALIPLIGAIWLLILECQPSEPQENRFGPVPNLEQNTWQ
ncbi:MAG: DUF805 domain-containing protein [Prevotella sp.]|nr:DUF805 domain-containing protein [Bacteroides sp.]MCM1365977.1 DUF805 domain-containing protein [Prevotella sp.]MCM1436602.1 DUF805 domain-containing protein [Prevotella sp.]